MSEVKSGYMQKCGKSVKNWKRRWFVLKSNGFLYYYENSSLKCEKGKLDVIDATKVAPWQEVGSAEKKLPPGFSYENTFAIVSDNRTYTCVCENEGESLSWVAAIEKVRGAAGIGDQVYPSPTYPKHEEEAQTKLNGPLESPPQPPQAERLPQKQVPPPSRPISQPPVVTMPQPQTYGGTMPNACPPQPRHASMPRDYRPSQPMNAAPPTGGFPAAGPGYQGAYPVGNYQAQPPRPIPQPMYPPNIQQAYTRPPPPRPQYYQQPPRPAYQSYPQRPQPPQYYRPPPPQQCYRPPPAPVRQTNTTTVTVVNLAAPRQHIIYR